MTRKLIRIVAILLVPCLLLEPVSAVTLPLVFSPLTRAPRSIFSPHTREAIVPALAVALSLGLGLGQKHPAIPKTLRTVSAASRREDSDPSDPPPRAQSLRDLALIDEQRGRLLDFTSITREPDNIKSFPDLLVRALWASVRSETNSNAYPLAVCGLCAKIRDTTRAQIPWRGKLQWVFTANDRPTVRGSVLSIHVPSHPEDHQPLVWNDIAWRPGEGGSHAISDFVDQSLFAGEQGYLSLANIGILSGGSVQEHLHYQFFPQEELNRIFPDGKLPVEHAASQELYRFRSASVRRLSGWLTNGIVIEGDTEDVKMALIKTNKFLSKLWISMNVMAVNRPGEVYRAYLVPRIHARPPLDVLDTWGVFQSFGLLVTGNKEKFEQLTSEKIRRAYREVGINHEEWQNWNELIRGLVDSQQGRSRWPRFRIRPRDFGPQTLEDIRLWVALSIQPRAFQQLDLADLLQNVIYAPELTTLINERNLLVNTKLPNEASHRQIFGQGAFIERWILYPLIELAIQKSPPGTTMNIDTSYQGRSIRIWIECDASVEAIKQGGGRTLPLARETLKAHQGDINVYPSSTGSMMALHFPHPFHLLIDGTYVVRKLFQWGIFLIPAALTYRLVMDHFFLGPDPTGVAVAGLGLGFGLGAGLLPRWRAVLFYARSTALVFSLAWLAGFVASHIPLIIQPPWQMYAPLPGFFRESIRVLLGFGVWWGFGAGLRNVLSKLSSNHIEEEAQELLRLAEQKQISRATLGQWFIEDLVYHQSPTRLLQRLNTQNLLPLQLIVHPPLTAHISMFLDAIWQLIAAETKLPFASSPYQKGRMTSQRVQVGDRTFHIFGIAHGTRWFPRMTREMRALIPDLAQRNIPLYSEHHLKWGYQFDYGQEIRDPVIWPLPLTFTLAVYRLVFFSSRFSYSG